MEEEFPFGIQSSNQLLGTKHEPSDQKAHSKK